MKESEVREICAKICESMIIGGRAWTEEQKIAADSLFAAAKFIRDDEIFNKIKEENK